MSQELRAGQGREVVGEQTGRHDSQPTSDRHVCSKRAGDVGPVLHAIHRPHGKPYGATSRAAAMLSIGTFARIAKPKRMRAIDTAAIDAFIGKRLKENRKRKNAEGQDQTVSPATVNRELRYVKSALRLAADWGFIEKVPRMRFLKPQQKLPTFTTPEHFAAMFKACEVATMPSGVPNVSPVDWWRGLLVLLYMTGWRIGQTLKLKSEDIDLEAGTALTQADANKGRRDQLLPLHPLAIEHLRPLAASFDSRVFPWDHDNRTLWSEFARIQEAAKLADGSPMPKGGKNGGWYGFHDLRRGFDELVRVAGLDATQVTRNDQGLRQHGGTVEQGGSTAVRPDTPSRWSNGLISGLEMKPR